MAEFQQTYDVLELYPDGTIRPGLRIIVTPEEDEKARHGYFCWHCAEDWSNSDVGAWPEGGCPVCGAAITSEEYANLFSGPAKNESRIDMDEENERLDRQGWERDRESGITTPGIWIPGSPN